MHMFTREVNGARRATVITIGEVSLFDKLLPDHTRGTKTELNNTS